MYYDLSFNADDLEPFAARERSAAATILGYSVVATNTTAVERLFCKGQVLMLLLAPPFRGLCTLSDE